MGHQDEDMDGKIDGVRTRSFKNEDYTNRRVFLRSYPLNLVREDGSTKEVKGACKKTTKRKRLKEKIIAVVEWGEDKVVVLKRFKDKVTVYFVACGPFRFHKGPAPACLLPA